MVSNESVDLLDDNTATAGCVIFVLYSVYLLLSPYHCFISLLYLDLYVIGDDALIS